MKRILLFAVLAVFGFSIGFAQDEGGDKDKFTGGFEQGDIYISGALGYWSTSTDDVKSNQFTIMPAVGYFVTDRISVGLTAGYMTAKGESGDIDTQDESTFSIGAYGAYNFMPDNRFNPFVGLAVGYESTSFNLDSDDYKVNGIGAGAFVGANYWFSDCFAIFTQLGVLSYSSLKPDFDDAEATNSFALNLDMKEVTFGAKFRF